MPSLTRVTNQVQTSCTEGSFTESDTAKPRPLDKTSMEVYQQVSIICTGYCSGTRDTSFSPGASCCHWSILFQCNQWSFDTWETSRIMDNKPSPLWEEQLMDMNHVFSSSRDNGQYINTSSLKWFLKNAFNKIGWKMSVCAHKSIPLPHTEVIWSHCFKDNYIWKKQLRENQIWFVVVLLNWGNKTEPNNFVWKEAFQLTWL